MPVCVCANVVWTVWDYTLTSTHSCLPVTLLDSRAVQGELGWVANPTEGGVCTAKKCPLVLTHGPLLSINREIIFIIGRSSGLLRQIDTQPSLIRFCPGEPFMGISLLLIYCLCTLRILGSGWDNIFHTAVKSEFCCVCRPAEISQNLNPLLRSAYS